MYPQIRKPYDRTRSYTSLKGQVSKTDRSSGNETDINTIVAKFARTGELPRATQEPAYADVTLMQQDLTDIIEKGEAAKRELKTIEANKRLEKAEKRKKDKEELASLRAEKEKVTETLPQ